MNTCMMEMAELAMHIAQGDITSERATSEALDRLESLGRDLNCVMVVERGEALDKARQADRQRAAGQVLGPLHGVPLAHKDIFGRGGKIVTAGSPILAGHRMEVTATVIERLRAAGAIEIGALHLAEFARSPTGYNIHYGSCRNPWDTTRVTGGSSSGSAAAVAARIVTGALGTDTGGSIRMPAAMCGLVGLRATSGQISRAGVLPLSWSLDAVGPLTRTARDGALMYDVIAGPDAADPTTALAVAPDASHGLMRAIAGVRIGVPGGDYFDEVPEDLRQRLDAALDVLRQLGACIVPVEIPAFDDLDAVQDVVREVECATVHSKWLREDASRYSDQVRARIEGGFVHLATRYCEALNLRSWWLAHFSRHVFEKADILFTPTVPMRVPTIEESSEGPEASVAAIIRTLGRTTRQIGYLGLPAMSVPAGFDDNAMPVGFQIVGRPFSESQLFRLAHAYQQATAWHTQAPCEPYNNDQSNQSKEKQRV